MLAEIERHLEQEDPRFMARARRAVGRGGTDRRLRLAAAGFVLGLLSLLGLTFHFLFGVVGFALMLVSVIAGAGAISRRSSAVAQRTRRRLRSLLDEQDEDR